jgi:hypothetical protein
MTALSTWMTDRWQHRADPVPSEGTVYWHMPMHEHRQVTRMACDAQGLGVTQPAASAALARLRRHFGDEFLVRDKGGYALTALAVALAEQVDACAGRPSGCSPRAPTSTRRPPSVSSPW